MSENKFRILLCQGTRVRAAYAAADFIFDMPDNAASFLRRVDSYLGNGRIQNDYGLIME